jgi:hypothetical protein
MRLFLLIDAALVTIIGSTLYLLSRQTATFFAWTIDVPLTAAFMGAAYWASCPLELLAARQRWWSHARIAVPSVFLFSTITLIVTLLHLDRFNFGAPAWYTRAGTWTWLLVYIAVPVLLGLFWLLQLRLPGGDPPRELLLPGVARAAFIVLAVLLVVVGLGLLLAPLSVAPWWPWTLTALTGRAVGAWVFAIGIACAQAVWENDWQRLRPLSVAFVFMGVLQLLALARFAADVDWSRAAVWVYVLVLLSMLVLGVAGWRAVRGAGH